MPEDKFFDYNVTYFIKPCSKKFVCWTCGRNLPEAMKLFYQSHSGLDIRISNIEQVDNKEQTNES